MVLFMKRSYLCNRRMDSQPAPLLSEVLIGGFYQTPETHLDSSLVIIEDFKTYAVMNTIVEQCKFSILPSIL